MPTYCYRTEEGDTFERVFQMGHAPGSIELPNGQVAIRDYAAEGVVCQMVGTKNPTRANQRPKRPWPMTCYASGVHASQAQELRQHLAERGCPTEVTKNGDPIYTSAAHRKKALKIRGFHDRASFG